MFAAKPVVPGEITCSDKAKLMHKDGGESITAIQDAALTAFNDMLC